MASINLWELMTREPKLEPIVNQLALKGRYGQELSIEPTDDGWLIKIFSCFDERELNIHINQDGVVEIGDGLWEAIRDRKGVRVIQNLLDKK